MGHHHQMSMQRWHGITAKISESEAEDKKTEADEKKEDKPAPENGQSNGDDSSPRAGLEGMIWQV